MSANLDNNNSLRYPGHKPVFMVGHFPPPVHGMAAVNAAVREQLIAAGAKLTVINIAAKSLDRSLVARSGRLPVILHGLYCMMFSKGLQNATLYMSVSGGFGQVYELFFLLLARRHKMRVYLHHHSFAYLNKQSMVTRLLVAAAGQSSTHITLSNIMAIRFKSLYPSASRILSISNAVYFAGNGSSSHVHRTSLKTIGFISNISEEKGIFDFLDLVEACESEGLPLCAKIAGPYQDADTEQKVRKRLETLNTVEYVGPQYGQDKKSFYDTIDVLVFPTRYFNEAEPLTIHEAMQCAIPVIAYGRGGIAEVVSPECGLVIEPDLPFARTALEKIKQWLDSPERYNAASCSAVDHFNAALANNTDRWQELLREILGSAFIDNSATDTTLEDAPSKT